jgi:iron-sulfur cluster repair protein YtfE (RIC family)
MPATHKRRELLVKIGHHFRQDYRWRFGAASALARIAARTEGPHDAFPHNIRHLIICLDTSVERSASKALACLAPVDPDHMTEAETHLSTIIDHKEVLGELDEMAQITHLYVAPECVGHDWKTLYAVYQSVDRSLRHHMSLEAAILASPDSALRVPL